MVKLIITWIDYPVDESDFDKGMKEERYTETYECPSFKAAAEKLSELDGKQYNGHEIVNYTMVG